MPVKFTLGPWEVVRHRHIDDEPWFSVNQCADAHGMKQWIAEIKYLTTAPDEQLANAHLIAKAPELREALTELVNIIDRAGLLNLSNGVQLGATSWFVKASERLEYAKRVLDDVDTEQSVNNASVSAAVGTERLQQDL